MNMIRYSETPLVYTAVLHALQSAGMELGTMQVSSGPLRHADVLKMEGWLSQHAETGGMENVHISIARWLRHGAGDHLVMGRDEAAGAENGAHPRSDLALLLEMAREGDL